jgi:hypothetical protein
MGDRAEFKDKSRKKLPLRTWVLLVLTLGFLLTLIASSAWIASA